jgi:CubicO group peptidase (beta-lactamase class C family)
MLKAVFSVVVLFSLTAVAQSASTNAFFPIVGPGAVAGTDSSSHYKNFENKLATLMKRNGIPGASVAVVKGGQIVYLRAFGYADKEGEKLAEPSSYFRLASSSKTLTAIGVFKLVSEGKVSLNQKVYPYLGLSPLPGEDLNPSVNQITVQNLLEMSAGWDRVYDPMFGPWPASQVSEYHLQTPMSCEAVAKYMMGRSLVSKPGANFAYQNIDYCLLGLVIAKATTGTLANNQDAYAAYMQKIFSLAGVNGMYLGSTDLSKRGEHEVTYYSTRSGDSSQTEGYIRLNDFPYGGDGILDDNYANGGWVARAEDIAKIFVALESGRILPVSQVKMLWSAPPGKPSGFTYFKGVQYLSWPYGMGMWRIQDHGKLLAMAHGSFTGTNTLIIRKQSGEVDVALFNAKPSTPAALFSFRQRLIELFDSI